jgi:hypothetical protein
MYAVKYSFDHKSSVITLCPLDVYVFLNASSEMIWRIVTCVHAFMSIHNMFCSSHTGHQSTRNQDTIRRKNI